MVPRWILAYSSIALAALVVLLVSCGGGGGGGEVHVPVISNPSVYPDWLTAGDGGGMVEVTFTLDFLDDGGDLWQAVLKVYNSQGILVVDQVVDIVGAGGITAGYLNGSLMVNTAVPDIFSVEAWVVDSGSHPSNILTGSMTVYDRIALSGQGVGDTEAVLNWTDPYNGTKGFVLERSTSPAGGFSEVATVEATAPNFVDTGGNGLVQGTTYYYRVRAEDAPYYSLGYGYSYPVDVTTLPAPVDTPTLYDASMTMEVVASLPYDIKGVEIAPDGDILAAAYRTIYKVNRSTFAYSVYSANVGGSGEELWDLAVDGAGRVFATCCWSSDECDILEIFADGSTAYLYTGPMNGASVDAGAPSTLYLGNPNGALYELDISGTAGTYLDDFYSEPYVRPNIYGVAAPAGGDLVFGHRFEGRLYRSDPQKNVTALANLPEYYIFSLAEGAATGTFYISGTWPDVAVFRLQDGVLSLLAAGLDGTGSIDSYAVNGAFGIAVDGTGAVFVGSGRDLWMISPL